MYVLLVHDILNEVNIFKHFLTYLVSTYLGIKKISSLLIITEPKILTRTIFCFLFLSRIGGFINRPPSSKHDAVLTVP